MNHKTEDLSDEFSFEHLLDNLEDGEPHKVLDVPMVTDQLIPAMLEASREMAEKKKEEILADAMQKMLENEQKWHNET